MSHRSKALLVGAVGGALIGAIFAWVASDRQGKEGGSAVQLKPADYFQLGIGLLSLARQFGNMVGDS